MASSRRSSATPATIAVVALAAVILAAYGYRTYTHREDNALIHVLKARPTSAGVLDWARSNAERTHQTPGNGTRDDEIAVCLKNDDTFLIWFGTDGRAQNWYRTHGTCPSG